MSKNNFCLLTDRIVWFTEIAPNTLPDFQQDGKKANVGAFLWGIQVFYIILSLQNRPL
jgi:hypothetical protein